MKEMHILELSKLPPEEKMRQTCCSGCAFGGKTRKDFEKWQRKILNWKKHMTYWIN